MTAGYLFLLHILARKLYLEFSNYRKGGPQFNNIIGILGAAAMGFAKFSESYELLILGRFLIGVNCGE